MKLCRFEANGRTYHGLVEGAQVIDREQDDEYALDEVRLLPPVQPRKFLAIGLNYADHIAESGMQAPEFPIFFNKQVTCVVGPGDDVHMPRVSSLLDYEGELAIVIGKRCRHVPPEQAEERDRRLHDRQRRIRPRLADSDADDDDGQVVRHPWAARSLDRDGRRAR